MAKKKAKKTSKIYKSIEKHYQAAKKEIIEIINPKTSSKQEESKPIDIARDKGYLTKNGVIVKSKAERVIADYLTSINLEWEYEKEFQYMGDEPIYPDFYLPEHDCYVEYFGMIDYHDEKIRKKYESQTKWKIDLYKRWNKKLIYLFPEDLQRPDFNERFYYKLDYVNSLYIK